MAQFTQEEYKKLHDELTRLKQVERPRVARDLKEAIEQGDISENAAYDEARERRSEIEQKIKELERKLSGAEIVEHSIPKDAIVRGTTFSARDKESGAEREFTLVGPESASPAEGKISVDSPLGGAFLGKRAGERVVVDTPAGKREYTIISIASVAGA